MTPVVAVIVNFNSGALLRTALDGLRHHAVSRTVVVDNASTDNSWQDGLGRTSVQIERMPGNVGFAAAVNHALSITDEPYVFLLNADVDMQPAYVERLIAALDEHPRLAAATGTLVLPNGRIDSTGIDLTTARWAMDRDRGREAFAANRHPFGVSGAAGLFRRAALEEVGGLWEELFVYWEDTELAWRLRRAGWQFAHVPEASATHARGSDSADPTFVEAANFGGRLATIARHEGWSGLLRPPSLAVTLVTGTRLAVRHPTALKTARPLSRIRAGVRQRGSDGMALALVPFSPHPWRAWLTAQVTGSRRGLGVAEGGRGRPGT